MIPTQEFVAEYQGVRVPKNPRLDGGRIRRINEGRYEGDELNAALKLIAPGDRVMELGAGIGFVGGAIAKLCPDVQVRSFEGNPELLADIRTLYKLNGVEDRIQVENKLVMTAADAPSNLGFRVHKRSYLGSSLMLSDVMMSEEVAVPTISFDQINREFGPNVLVMDIEGGEMDFLRHADLSGIRAVIIEFHLNIYGREGLRECKSILRKAGFEPDDEISSRTVWGATRALN